MIQYEIVMTDLGSEILKATDPDGVVWWIPIDPTNADYEAYLASLNEVPAK